MIYENLVEKIMQHYSSGDHTPEVIQAKKEFFEQAGVFDETSDEFEWKAGQFMDWYVFSRTDKQSQRTPVELAAREQGLKLTPEEQGALVNLINHRHSLFEFKKIKGSDVHIQDLFSGYKHIVKNSPVTEGFDRGQVFEARIIPHEDYFLFSKAFCFHPAQAYKFILKEVKDVKKLPAEEQSEARKRLIARLFRMRSKYDQYRHVDVLEIYSNESKLRL